MSNESRSRPEKIKLEIAVLEITLKYSEHPKDKTRIDKRSIWLLVDHLHYELERKSKHDSSTGRFVRI